MKINLFSPKQKVGHITLIERIQIPNKKGSHRNYWKYQCDCGNKGMRREESIKENLNISCGCKRHITQVCGKNNKKWGGYEDVSRDYFRIVKIGAQKRNLEFSISIEDMWNQFIKQNKICPFLNKQLVLSTRTQQTKGIEQTASLDRIDSLKGYTKDNIRWIHKDINMMKSNLSDREFINLIHLIIENHGTSTSNIPEITP